MSLEELVNASVDNLTLLRGYGRDDDGTFNYPSDVDWLKINGVNVSRIYISSNGWIGFGVSSEQFKFNRRDTQSKAFFKEIGTLWNKYRFLRIRWLGFSPYSSSYYDNEAYREEFDLIAFDTGDLLLVTRKIPETYDGTFSFQASVVYNYNKPSMSSPYVTFKSKDENNTVYDISYKMIDLVPPYRYLYRKQSGELFNVVDGKLVMIEANVLTAAVFEEYGMQGDACTDAILNEEEIELLCWSNIIDPDIDCKVNAIPFYQTVYSEDIDLTHESILGIEHVTVDASEDVMFAISTDGEIWMMWTGTEWGVLSEEDSGMSAETVNNITTESWNNVVRGIGSFKIRARLRFENSYIKNLEVSYIN